MKCFKAGCEFETEFVPNSSAVELMKLHVSLHHQVKEEEDNAGANSGGKAVFKAVKCNVVWKKDQSFESFQKEIKTWKDATNGLTSHAKDMLFIESISNAEDPEVKDYYVKNIMNNDAVPKTIDSVLEKLNEQFGKSERQKWDEAFRNVGCFTFDEKSPKEAWDSIEVVKYNVEDVWKPKSGDPVHNDASYLLNKLLIRNYLSKGEEEKKFDKSIVPKLEEEIEAVDYDWTRTKQILRTNVFEY